MPAAEFHAPLPAPPPLSADWALFLDVDGCLLEFEEDPDRVRAPASLSVQLAAVSRRLGGALALVSGRGIAGVDRVFAPARFPVGGLHGLERRGAPMPDADTGAAIDPATWGGLIADARVWMATHPLARVEDKGRALALHWRADASAEARARAFASTALAALPGYRLQPGDCVLELRPEGADKGAAIAAFLDEPPFAGRRPVFAGDDLTDEHGFALVNRRDGISIVVGDRRPTLATHWLANPAAVRRWLEEVA
ncbi:trehalose-phosphatase [Thermomonas sp. XSG]|uniref:trehalose-phosphatase n=1 Tax=Thermomonas sp. XSG TaxID=2771436 RepID=UPI001680EF04|nr:trehalose-phosphatase [Thermomonas sp. XSG]QNU15950.1 trehalose-phosphatase [Thermomonas sp. XSG]